MKEYHFFLSILPKYKKGKNVQYINELKYLYNLYQKYQSIGLLQDDILNELEFTQLHNILLLNELKFNHNFPIQTVSKDIIDFLNQLYDYFPESFQDITENNIYLFRNQVVKKIPSFIDSNIKTVISFPFTKIFKENQPLLLGTFCILSLVSISFYFNQTNIDFIESVIKGLSTGLYGFFSGYATLLIFHSICIDEVIEFAIKHPQFKSKFPEKLVDRIRHYQMIPNNVHDYSDYNNSISNFFIYAFMQSMIEKNPNILKTKYEIHNNKDIEKVYKLMKMSVEYT